MAESEADIESGLLFSDGSEDVLQQLDDISIKNLEYPWKDTDDKKPTDLEYELFCGALESFWSKPLAEHVDDWTISLETILPTLRSSIRMYSEAAPSEEKVREVDIELARWVQFGLSSSQSGLYPENSHLVMIGCSLVKHLSLMHDRQLSATFCEPCYLRYIMDIILAEQYCASIRCEAARALLHVLFHLSVSHEFMLVKTENDVFTPYEQIVRLFLKSEDVPLDLLEVLQKIAAYFSFKYSTDLIRKCSERCVNRECDFDVCQLLNAFSVIQKFFSKIRNDFSYTSRIAHQTLVKCRTVPHLCAFITSPDVTVRVKHSAVQCLRSLCDFDGTDISGAIFLSHMDSRVILLVGQLLQRVSGSDRRASTTLLPYALRAVVLIDQLAYANVKDGNVVDAQQYLTVLRNMLSMLTVEGGRRALVSALSYKDNLEHVLHAFDTKKSVLTLGSHGDEDHKTRFRHTATYGYLCEILFAVARNQSSGAFWRKHGPAINKLIDCNLISAATSLKQWMEPFRDELALGINMSTLNFLLLRLANHSEKYLDGDPPLPLVTLLRLIDAILDEPEKFSYADVSPCEIRFDYCTRFCEDDGLRKVTCILNVANDEQSKRVRGRCTSLSCDSYIYSQFVRSATSIIYKVFVSLQAINHYPEKVTASALLRTYSLCCMDELCFDRTVRGIILKSFALFVAPDIPRQGVRRFGQQSFLELLLKVGFEKPSNFFAVLDILRHLLPIPSYSLVNAVGINPENAILIDKLWSDSILACEKQLQFAVLLGISSSRRLRQCLYDLLIRLAWLSKDIALRLVDILVKQSLKMLKSSAYAAITDAFEEESVEEEESNVRFGAAADVATASFFAFMATCSAEFIFRNPFIAVISQRKNYISTVLKFFKLASPKTLPHVSFQRHIIKFFRNICNGDGEFEGTLVHLPHEIYIAICDSLVEHFGNSEHDLETAVLALKVLCDIGRFSTFGNAAISKSLVGREGMLLHFVERLNSMSSPNEKLLSKAAAIIAELLEDIIKKESVKSVLLKFKPSGCNEHPLLRLKVRMMELDFSEHVISLIENAVEAANKAETLEGPDDKIVDWPENVATTVLLQTDSRGGTKRCLPDMLNVVCENRTDFDYSAPVSSVDLSMLDEEFFSGAILTSAKESTSEAHAQGYSPVATKIQSWKTLGFEGSKRKRLFGVTKTHPTIKPKIRRH